MQLKYQHELSRYENCPPAIAKAFIGAAFRFVHEDREDGRNFLVVAKISPGRQLPDDQRCAAHALSLFVSQEAATKFFQILKGSNKKIHLSIGTHLATGVVAATDGRATPPRQDGHFSFFESASCDLAGKFNIVTSLL